MSRQTSAFAKARFIVGAMALSLGYIAGSTAAQRPLPPIPVDALGVTDFGAVATAPSAGASLPVELSSRETASIVAQTAACGGTAGGNGSAGRPSRPTSPVHIKAGTTAERFGETHAGRLVRRHRAPVSLLRIVKTAARKHGVHGYILAGLAEDESSWRPTVRGRNGEVGLLQLSTDTAAWCGGVDRRDATQNADCAARWLGSHFRRFGSWELALVAYKAGPETIPERIPAKAWEFAQRTLVKAEAYR